MMTDAIDEAQLTALVAQPGPLWLFKHSSTCGISAEANEQVASFAEAHPAVPIARIIVQTQRPLSNWASARFSLSHQSPQLLLVRGGKLVWSASHWQITHAAMADAVAAAS